MCTCMQVWWIKSYITENKLLLGKFGHFSTIFFMLRILYYHYNLKLSLTAAFIVRLKSPIFHIIKHDRISHTLKLTGCLINMAQSRYLHFTWFITILFCKKVLHIYTINPNIELMFIIIIKGSKILFLYWSINCKCINHRLLTK